MKRKQIKKHFFIGAKIIFWFGVGSFLGLFLFLSFVFIIFQKINSNVVYPGIIVDGIDLGGKTELQVKEIFAEKNKETGKTKFAFSSNVGIATISASQIEYGYDQNLIASQTISIGRSKNIFSDITLMSQAYLNGILLQTPYRYSETALLEYLKPIAEKLRIDPIDAVFAFENNKVTAFKQSSDGQEMDLEAIKRDLNLRFKEVISQNKQETITISIPIKVIKPNITTEKVNNLGIKELIGEGISFFQHSIPGRIYNIKLAAERLNGIIIAPNETFSFNKALGDISAFTGYKQAYIIQNGKTVLGDGGGVCQVSTTFFRALLNAGLPITERHAHAYRVGYYEQNSPPGLDATIYSPSVDLKFKNDTKKYILIQTFVDPNIQKLTFSLFGTSDKRKSTITESVITNRTPPPPDLYQDDPTLSKGIIKQIDFAAEGARVSFNRRVERDGKIIISDTFVSNFRPWRAVFLRGTKE